MAELVLTPAEVQRRCSQPLLPRPLPVPVPVPRRALRMMGLQILLMLQSQQHQHWVSSVRQKQPWAEPSVGARQRQTAPLRLRVLKALAAV